ncbi:MAG: membrane protein insertase YidC [Planctomycetota bacterium]|jgi:YidC/Oxa1 family membrane protein insertase
MKLKIILGLILTSFIVFCGWLIVETPCFDNAGQVKSGPCILLQQETTNQLEWSESPPAEETAEFKAADIVNFTADSAPSAAVELGSIDPASGFKFKLELTSKGAAIRRAILSEFDDRDYKNPQPFVLLSAVQLPGREVLSMASADLVFTREKMRLRLDKLNWTTQPIENSAYYTQTARFEAIIKADGRAALKITKTYTVNPGSYHLQISQTVENLSESVHKVRFNLSGPVGLGREAIRMDMRKAVAGFREQNGQVASVRLDTKKLSKATTLEDRRLNKPGSNFLWLAATNKYFAAILVPEPDPGKEFCNWVIDKTGRFYNPDGDQKRNSGDETVGVDLKIASTTLAPAGQPESSRVYNFQFYLGPKDKSLFDKNEFYRKLGFVQSIDFLACCCPSSIIYPMAFGILAVMKGMYSFIGNYGVVIIILVFFVRLILHPLTKKGQVSMSKMTKLAPRAEELKKKYAGNKTELNKQLMALYREQGASPVTGMLPMFIQMPIWIALYSAIFTSIELRGAPFLPFWITDLSAPDAAIRFATVTIPLLGWKIDSLNLLPLLMGLAFYLQQKLMPSQAAVSSNPQAAQQQKMMMFMMPLLFPIMLYKAPSGLNLYIMASTFAGVIEQYVIKKHIREKEQAEAVGLVPATSKTGGKVKKKKPKPFFRT